MTEKRESIGIAFTRGCVTYLFCVLMCVVLAGDGVVPFPSTLPLVLKLFNVLYTTGSVDC